MTGVELFAIAGHTVTLGNVLSVAGLVTSAMGAGQQYDATADAAQYNAAVERNKAAAEEDRRRRESARQLGQIRAGRAKSGVTMEGTPLMVLAESAEMAELDALNARWSGETTARLDEQRAASARKAKPYAVGSSLLAGISKIGARSL